MADHEVSSKIPGRDENRSLISSYLPSTLINYSKNGRAKSLNARIEAEGMVFRMFVLFIGFGLAVSGGVSLIIYLNLLTTGMTFSDYILFVSTRVECYLFLLGILIITLSIYIPRRKNNHYL